MKVAALVVAGIIAARAQDPQITTSNGVVRISADDVEFQVNGMSQTFSGLKTEIESRATATADAIAAQSSAADALSTAIANDVGVELSELRSSLIALENQVNTEISTQLDAVRTNLTDALEDVGSTAAAALEAASVARLQSHVGEISGVTCDASTIGVMTYIITPSGCHGTYICTRGSGLSAIQTSVGLGNGECHPAESCAQAVNENGAGGSYYVGTVADNELTECTASGFPHGDGTAENPALSCADLFRTNPQLRARGKRTYKIRNAAGHWNYHSFQASECARENQACDCTRRGFVENSTHKVAVRYGARSGNTHRWSHGVSGAVTHCTNAIFGDPWSGRGKACYCGWAELAESRDVVCDPRMDARIQLRSLRGWWKAENYPLAEHPTVWPSTDPFTELNHLPNSATFPNLTAVAHITNPQGWTRGSPDGQQAHLMYNWLQGGTSTEYFNNAAKFPFPTIGTQVSFGRIDRQYAICTTSRYVPGGSTGRIFVTDVGNWLHGHHSGQVGRVYYDGWVNWNNLRPRFDWVATCTTWSGGRSHYTTGGSRRTIRSVNRYGSRGFGIGLGPWARSERSLYGFGEVLLWDRAFSDNELRNANLYLTARLAS